ncbi:hypothetical protein ACJX0J_038521, partial [Zea mays]
LRPGHIFNIGAGKQALKNINSLALFSNIEVNPRPDETKEGGIVVEIKLKELEPKSAEVSTEWSIVPGREGRPTLASIQPGGTVSFEHRNIYGLNRSIVGSVTSSNLLNPQDDLSFKLEYEIDTVPGISRLQHDIQRAVYHGINNLIFPIVLYIDVRSVLSDCLSTYNFFGSFITVEEANNVAHELTKGEHHKNVASKLKTSKMKMQDDFLQK